MASLVFSRADTLARKLVSACRSDDSHPRAVAVMGLTGHAEWGCASSRRSIKGAVDFDEGFHELRPR